MFLSRRTALALAVVVTLSLAIAPRGGLYSPAAVLLAVAALPLALAACLLPDRRWQVPADLGARFINYATILLGAQAFFLAFFRSPAPATEPVGLVKDEVALVVGLVVLALLVVLARRPPRPDNLFHALLVAAGVLLSGYGVLKV
jgi:hypothetical protein